jgi:hypothetical protein
MKSKIVNIRGREIKVSQISFIGKINLMHENSQENLIKNSMSNEDFVFLKNIEEKPEDINDINSLIKTINEVNGWDKEDDKSFQENGQIVST